MATDERGSMVVGLSIPQSQDAAHLLQAARDDAFDFVTTALPQTLEPRTDVTQLESRWWRTSVVGRIESWSDRMEQQMEWANHMNIPAVLLPEVSPNSDHARIVSTMALASTATNGQLWIRTALTEQSLAAFDTLHRQCDGASNVGMMLCLDNVAIPTNPAHVAAAVAAQVILLHKAIGAQLKALCFPTSIFLTNKRGYPALSKTHQVLFTEVLRRIGRTVRILIEGPTLHELPDSPAAMGATKCLPYLQYIRHMRQRPEVLFLDGPEASQEEPYLDHLQRPLQPLADHLEFQTYETFERDPIKYAEYQKAIQLAMQDGIANMATDSPNGNKVIVIMVVGAGRGPLVSSALQAIKELPSVPPFIRFQVFAVEKNPSAIVYLESLARHDPTWKGVVTVVHSDMRQLSSSSLGGLQADIIVSELLGSFGDNELSPECLDGVYTTGLWKDSTICIPQQYTSYLAPVSSMRLHAEGRAQAYFPKSPTDGLDSAPMGTLCAMETPYVVRTHAACQTHVEQPCWHFVHPSPQPVKERSVTIEFPPDVTHGAGCGSGYGPFDPAVASMAQGTASIKSGQVTLHGFLGTFTAVLYQSPRPKVPPVVISTRPSNFSVGMFSWFPLYFPIKEPIRVPGGASVLCSMWRRVESNPAGSSGRVWYEWTARVIDRDGETIAVTPIHNPNGRSYHVSL